MEADAVSLLKAVRLEPRYELADGRVDLSCREVI